MSDDSLEAGQDLARVHARLEDPQRHHAAERLGLLGPEDDTGPALANLLQELVGPNHRAGAFTERLFIKATTGLGAGRLRKLPAWACAASISRRAGEAP